MLFRQILFKTPNRIFRQPLLAQFLWHVISFIGLGVMGGQMVDRLLASYAEKCPAYQSVKGCIACSWDAEIAET